MARRFHFPLETLLNVRRLHEREAKRKVAAQQAEIARLDQLNAATREAITARQEALLRDQSTGALRTVDLSRGRAWIAHLRNTLAQRVAQRIELVRTLGQLQAEFRDARRATRIIEKLRERRWNEFAHDRARREQSASDELAQQLHTYAPLASVGSASARP